LIFYNLLARSLVNNRTCKDEKAKKREKLSFFRKAFKAIHFYRKIVQKETSKTCRSDCCRNTPINYFLYKN